MNTVQYRGEFLSTLSFALGSVLGLFRQVRYSVILKLLNIRFLLLYLPIKRKADVARKFVKPP